MIFNSSDIEPVELGRLGSVFLAVCLFTSASHSGEVTAVPKANAGVRLWGPMWGRYPSSSVACLQGLTLSL